MPPKYAKAQALERKAAAQATKDAQAAAEEERQLAASWAVGSNTKGAAKQREAEEKAAAKAAKQAEKNKILEDEANSAPASGKKTKKKGKDDFDMLNAALAAAPKTKAQKEAEAEAKRKEEAKRREEERRLQKEQEKKAEEEARRKAAAKGIVLNHGDDLMVENTNHRGEDEFASASGLDGALDLLAVGDKAVDKHPERRQKAAFNAYTDKMLPILKEEHPGLKLSQYKERIFQMWKTAPENPHLAASS